MISSLLGKKIGMTQVYDSANCLIPVTVVEAGPCAVVQVKTTETDGYHAVQIGFSKKKAKNTSKAEQSHAAKAGLTDTPRVLSEVRLTAASTLKVGDIVTVAALTEGQLVDVSGVSKGKGFQGTVKRHHFRRGPETHGSDSHRAPGSIGGGTTPGKVFKGTPMSGHMGNDRVTVRKATIVRADAERNLLLVKGPVPGARNALILVRKA